jgi:hypothetical protein
MRMLIASMVLLILCSTHAATNFEEVRQRVAELQPKAEEKRFDEIGWAKDIREARRLAKEHNRLVFLITHDGRMNIGRC